MTYEVPRNALEAELLRHRHINSVVGGETRRFFEQIGVASGWRCLDVGAGAGFVVADLAQMVGGQGSVLGIDIDLALIDREMPERPANVSIERRNLVEDELPKEAFDLVHARGLLQHLPDPRLGLERMVEATRSGGWVIATETDWLLYDAQPMPQPFGDFMRAVREMTAMGQNDHQRDLCTYLHEACRGHRLEELSCSAFMWDMRGGQPSCEWLMLALEWAAQAFEANGVAADLIARALAQARQPDFHIMSPLQVTLMGRKP